MITTLKGVSAPSEQSERDVITAFNEHFTPPPPQPFVLQQPLPTRFPLLSQPVVILRLPQARQVLFRVRHQQEGSPSLDMLRSLSGRPIRTDVQPGKEMHEEC